MPTTSRDEYVAQLKTQLDRWNAQIARWDDQARGATNPFAEPCKALRERRERALSKLRRLA